MAKTEGRNKAPKAVQAAPQESGHASPGVEDLEPSIRERLFGGDADKESDGTLELFYHYGVLTDEEKLVRDLILFFRQTESEDDRDKAYYSKLEFLRNSRNPSILGPRKPRRVLAMLCALIVAELQRDVVRMLRNAEL
jgi:hypothetical protein